MILYFPSTIHSSIFQDGYFILFKLSACSQYWLMMFFLSSLKTNKKKLETIKESFTDLAPPPRFVPNNELFMFLNSAKLCACISIPICFSNSQFSPVYWIIPVNMQKSCYFPPNFKSFYFTPPLLPAGPIHLHLLYLKFPSELSMFF